MEKHEKRAKVFAALALVFMLSAFVPIFLGVGHKTMGFIFEHKETITTLQLIFGVVGIVFYVVSTLNRNTVETMLRNQKTQKKKEELNSIVQLIKDGKNKEAVDALYDYDNKY